VTTGVICKEIRCVQGGYIIELRWPYGPEPGGYGEVVCDTFDEVIALLREAAEAMEP
jgi:hypothetical protein